jgi:hypothetical protein
MFMHTSTEELSVVNGESEKYQVAIGKTQKKSFA